MKLDMDLVRQILLAVEAFPANSHGGTITVPEYDENVVLEHLDLLVEKGLIEGHPLRAGSGNQRVVTVFVNRLTWEGHEFLGNARNDQVWTRTQEIVKEKGGSVSFEVFKGLLTQVAIKLAGLA